MAAGDPSEPPTARPGAAAAVDAYVAAWNSPDDSARHRFLERSVTEDCVFLGPTGRCDGIDGISQLISDARDFLPGARLERVGEVEQAEHSEWRFRWRVRSPEGSTVFEGRDAVECGPDGRLQQIRVLST